MKKIYFLTLLIVLSGCSSNTNKMIVTGNIDGLKKGTVYLQQQQDSTIVNLDSININGNSEFILNTEIEEPDIYYLYLVEDIRSKMNLVLSTKKNL